jgi:hypothetical protein
MKGLLLKDWYMALKYCRIYLLFSAIFIVASVFDGDNLILLFYPCMLCGMIPVNLLGYDERSRWLTYCDALPCTRTQFVCAKYLIGLLIQTVLALLTVAAQGVRMGLAGSFAPSELLALLLMLVAVATFSSSIALPFVFKLGAEKGRAGYYAMVGFVCAAVVIGSRLSLDPQQLQLPVRPGLLLGSITLVCICIYALSWMLSVRFYQKREL